MKKLFLIILIALITSCAGNRTSRLIKTNAVNSSKACEILAANQKIHDKSAVKKSRGRIRQKSIPVINRDALVQEIANRQTVVSVTQDVAEMKLTETSETISLVSNEEFFHPTESVNRQTARDTEVNSKSETVKSTASKPVSTFFKKAYQSFRESTQALLLIGLAGLVSLGVMKLGERKSKRVTHWAKKNPMLSRSAIVGAQLITTVGGLTLGHDLYNNGMVIPEFSKWLPIGIFTAAASLYPNKFVSGNIPAFTYMRRKLHDIALFTSGAMMMTYAGNHYSISTETRQQEEIVFSVFNPVNSQSQLTFVKKDFTAPVATKEKKQFTKGQRAGAIAGTVIGFVFLTLVVAGFSCALICSGNGGAAALLIIGGEGLLIWAFVAILKSIKARSKPKTVARMVPSA